jgi:uncharacterized protein YuzE
MLTEEVDGETYYFIDLNNTGELDTFEDWREGTCNCTSRSIIRRSDCWFDVI